MFENLHPANSAIRPIFRLTTLCVAISSISIAQIAIADTVTKSDGTVKLSPIVVNAEEENRYEQGKQEQYSRDGVVIYKDKQETERYKGVSPADLLSGIPGVYSSDARNNGAITPNIRGLQGEGRIPTVVDGTRSEYTVYRGYMGVNNRTYVDPNLISEVKAYKGATDLQYGMPHAGGGAIVLNTLDAKDIIPEGKNWGINVKYETNNNSIAPQYPKINYGERFDTPENFWAFFYDANPELYKTLPSSGKGRFFNDYAFRVAVAGQTDLFDVTLAYSKREQGNYFSGTKKGDVYKKRFMTNNPSELDFADIAPPGHEAPNTSSNNESILLKNNWYFANNQQLKLSYRHSDLEFGEIMNSRSAYSEVIKNVFDYGPNSVIGTQWTPAKVKQDAGRIDYSFNPKGSKWLDLKAGLWYSKTNAQNNSSGGPIAAVAGNDSSYDLAFMDMLLNKSCAFGDTWGTGATKFNLNCKITQQDIEQARQNYKNITGYDLNIPVDQLKIVNPAQHFTKNKQSGFDLANTFRPHKTLEWTVGTNLHKQQLDGHMIDIPVTCASYNQDGACVSPYPISQYIFPPKSGKRDEYNLWSSLKWQPIDKLTITVGGRWGRSSIEDTDADRKLTSGVYSRADPIISRTETVYKKLTTEQKSELDKFYEQTNSRGKTRAEIAQIKQQRDDYITSLGYDPVKTMKRYRYNTKYINEKNEKIYNILARDVIWQADEQGQFRIKNNPLKNLASGEYHAYAAMQQTGEYFDGISELNTKKLTEEEKHQPIGKIKNHAFDPSFAISYQITPYIRTYASYSQYSRFTSLYEGTTGFSDEQVILKIIEPRIFKPEVAKNFEIGYVHDLTGLLPNIKYADIKLNYYQNKIKNVIDRASDINRSFFYQYDRQESQGVELQTRLDTGKVFADLGYSYLIKNRVCDADAGENLKQFNPEYGTYDKLECFTAGFPSGYLRAATPPKHSVSLNIGSRFLADKLVLGARFNYQSMSNAKKIAKEGARGGDVVGSGLNTFPWDSYYTIDAYVDYMIHPAVKLSLIGTNLTNVYYPDALTRTVVPAPGRTLKLGIDMKF